MRNIRVSILVITLILLAIGIIMIYSSSAIYAHEKMDDSNFFLKRHLLFLGLGFFAGIFCISFDYNRLKSFGRPLLLLSLTLLVMVLVPSLGSEAGGARRWFRFFSISFQPSELVKLTLAVYLADFLSKRTHKINNLVHTILPFSIITFLVSGLILMQPDLGTSVLIGMMALIMLFGAGLRWSNIFAMLGSLVPIFYLLIARTPYRLKRIKVFLNPWQDPQGSGFQIIQSFLALGSGGIFGVGLGMSKQKLFYLPEAHTDFVFSIIGEELGIMGTLSVTLLFMALIWQGMRIVFKVQDSFGRFLSLGIISMIALEVLINIGVSIGALPTKGLPLPFLSYGGSALVVHMASIGLLLNIAKDKGQA